MVEEQIKENGISVKAGEGINPDIDIYARDIWVEIGKKSHPRYIFLVIGDENGLITDKNGKPHGVKHVWYDTIDPSGKLIVHSMSTLQKAARKVIKLGFHVYAIGPDGKHELVDDIYK